MEKEWYTLTEIQTVINVSHGTMLNYVKAGTLKAVKHGGRGKWKVSAENFRRFLAGEPQIDYTADEMGE